jgi:putative ABC transport system substrate-binding protein
MRRREFITLLGGAAVAWPVVARAQQQSAKLPTIGVLGTASPSAWSSWTGAFVERLRELGWIDRRTVAIEYRWAEGRDERFAEIAAEFVRLKVDVIVTSGGAVHPVMQATSVIPIVFSTANNPVGSGFVASLARPGGNVTGLSNQSSDLFGKRLEVLREVVPGLTRLAIMGNNGNASAVLEMGEIQTTVRSLGLDSVPLQIRRTEDIALAFEALKGRTEALYLAADPLMVTNRLRISTFAIAARLPVIYPQREFVDVGGLMSYGSNVPDLFRRSANYVDKILRGASPSDMPVEQPTKFDLVVNMVTARALGLIVPPSLLARADEVIE